MLYCIYICSTFVMAVVDLNRFEIIVLLFAVAGVCRHDSATRIRIE